MTDFWSWFQTIQQKKKNVLQNKNSTLPFSYFEPNKKKVSTNKSFLSFGILFPYIYNGIIYIRCQNNKKNPIYDGNKKKKNLKPNYCGR